MDGQIACHHELPIKLKGEFYRTIIRSVISDPLREFILVTQVPTKKKSTVDMKMLRWISELTRKD